MLQARLMIEAGVSLEDITPKELGAYMEVLSEQDKERVRLAELSGAIAAAGIYNTMGSIHGGTSFMPRTPSSFMPTVVVEERIKAATTVQDWDTLAMNMGAERMGSEPKDG